jgi:hypothetical protein
MAGCLDESHKQDPAEQEPMGEAIAPQPLKLITDEHRIKYLRHPQGQVIDITPLKLVDYDADSRSRFQEWVSGVHDPLPEQEFVPDI